MSDEPNSFKVAHAKARALIAAQDNLGCARANYAVAEQAFLDALAPAEFDGAPTLPLYVDGYVVRWKPSETGRAALIVEQCYRVPDAS
jgi:hypothetical protein